MKINVVKTYKKNFSAIQIKKLWLFDALILISGVHDKNLEKVLVKWQFKEMILKILLDMS